MNDFSPTERGWYLDPDGAETLRYWNGKNWTGETRELEHPIERYRKAEAKLASTAESPPPVETVSPPRSSEPAEMDATETAGYVFAIFGGWIGILFGLALIARGSRHGVWVLVTSVIASILWTVLIFVAVLG